MRIFSEVSAIPIPFGTERRLSPPLGESLRVNPASARSSGPLAKTELDLQELLEIARLRRIDQMVRAHERAHIIAGGELVRGRANYTYRIGPDGKRYAVGGEVRIDTSPVPGDPEATLRKAEKIIRAALAPINPSPQDLRVAMKARMMALEARMEIIKEKQAQAKEAEGENR